MLNQQIKSLLGLANVSRNIVTGDQVLASIRNNKAKLVMIAEDASDNTKKKFQDKCSYYHVECLVLGTSEEISHAIGKQNRMVISILDANFANKILERGR